MATVAAKTGHQLQKPDRALPETSLPVPAATKPHLAPHSRWGPKAEP